VSKYQAVAGGKWFPKLIKAVNLKDERFSSLEYLDAKVNTPINAALFTEERMSSAR